MTKSTIFFAGANIHARMILQAHRPAGLVVHEVGTERAAKLAAWLPNDIDNPPPLADLLLPSTRYVEVSKFDGPEALSAIQDFAPDYLISGGAGIVREPLLSMAPVLNAHPGLLPDYRGLDPVLWSLKNGDPVGATLHIMDAGIDTGPILIREELEPIDGEPILATRLRNMRLCAALIARFLDNPAAYPPIPQDPAEGRYFPAYQE